MQCKGGKKVQGSVETREVHTQTDMDTQHATAPDGSEIGGAQLKEGEGRAVCSRDERRNTGANLASLTSKSKSNSPPPPPKASKSKAGFSVGSTRSRVAGRVIGQQRGKMKKMGEREWKCECEKGGGEDSVATVLTD